jgi:predicted nucleic acid-binding protein
VLGEEVSALLAALAAPIDVPAPDAAADQVRRHLPAMLLARDDNGPAEGAALIKLEAVTVIVTPVPVSSYAPMCSPALARIDQRDTHDWPVLACALLLNCPIWTEDHDFYGSGVATWTTALVELYFSDQVPGSAEH